MWASLSKWVLLTGCRQVFYKSIFPSIQGLEKGGWCLVFCIFPPFPSTGGKLEFEGMNKIHSLPVTKMNVFCDIDSILWWWRMKNLEIGKSFLFGLEDKTSQSSYSDPPQSAGLILLPGCSLKVKTAVLLDLLLWSLGCAQQDPMFISTNWVPERFFSVIILYEKERPWRTVCDFFVLVQSRDSSKFLEFLWNVSGTVHRT